MLSTSAKNRLLDQAATIAWASLHSAWPGINGANEISTARAAISWSAASAGRRTSAGFGITVSAGTTVAWVGAWSAQTGGVFQCAAPLGGLVYDFSTPAGTDRITVIGHPFIDTQPVVIYGGTPPAPLVEGTTYYVRDAIQDSFRVASTPGGSRIALTAHAADAAVISSIEAVTISGSAALVNVPGMSMRWDPNYPPVWNQSVTSIDIVQGGTFDLRTICTDFNGDTLTFALAYGSQPLPAGVSLAASGILSASSNATVGQTPWTYFTADDGA